MQRVTIPKPITSTSENNIYSLKKSIMKKSINNFKNKRNSISKQALKTIKGGDSCPFYCERTRNSRFDVNTSLNYGGGHVTIIK